MITQDMLDIRLRTGRIDRATWLLGIADAVGSAADCTRRQCGCVIFDPQSFHIQATGYNGRAAGLPGCKSEGACPRGRLTFEQAPSATASNGAAGTSYLSGSGACDAIHAEDNALRRAKAWQVDVRGAWAAVSAEPCEPCYVLLRHYGIAGVIWPGGERVL